MTPHLQKINRHCVRDMPSALGETEKKSSSPFAAHVFNLVASATLSTLRLLDVYFLCLLDVY